MIVKTKILKELKYLDRLYRGAGLDVDFQGFCSKLALLELCGWIEESIDDIVRIRKKRLREPSSIQYAEKVIVDNSDFSYKKFRDMMVKIIGLAEMERIERSVDRQSKSFLQSSLSNLKKMRDNHAHTYLNGGTHILHAPSVSLAEFKKIYNALRDYEKVIRK